MIDKLDEMLQEEKKKVDEVEVPNELEGKLIEALEKAPKKNNKRFYKRIAIIILIFLSYQFPGIISSKEEGCLLDSWSFIANSRSF